MPEPLRTIQELIGQIEGLHADMVDLEQSSLSGDLHQAHLDGARNLLHYMGLRRQCCAS